MSISSKGLDLIKEFEGLRLEAHLCPAKVISIGYGTTRYPDGQAIKWGDKITEQQAESL
jgi:lysozyme